MSFSGTSTRPTVIHLQNHLLLTCRMEGFIKWRCLCVAEASRFEVYDSGFGMPQLRRVIAGIKSLSPETITALS